MIDISKQGSNNLKYDFSISMYVYGYKIQLSIAIMLGLIRHIITGNRTANLLYTNLHELGNFEQFICLYFHISSNSLGKYIACMSNSGYIFYIPILVVFRMVVIRLQKP